MPEIGSVTGNCKSFPGNEMSNHETFRREKAIYCTVFSQFRILQCIFTILA